MNVNRGNFIVYSLQKFLNMPRLKTSSLGLWQGVRQVRLHDAEHAPQPVFSVDDAMPDRLPQARLTKTVE